MAAGAHVFTYICFPPFKSSVNYLVKKDLGLVSLLSHGITFKSLSVSITESAFAFSPPFYLHPVRPCLHSAYHPKMEGYRLTTFHIIHHVLSDYRRFRLRLSADSLYVRVTPNWKGSSDCTPFGSSLSAVLACSS